MSLTAATCSNDELDCVGGGRAVAVSVRAALDGAVDGAAAPPMTAEGGDAAGGAAIGADGAGRGAGVTGVGVAGTGVGVTASATAAGASAGIGVGSGAGGGTSMIGASGCVRSVAGCGG